jgi:tRNA (guanine37-N1)-methyltransferase
MKISSFLCGHYKGVDQRERPFYHQRNLYLTCLSGGELELSFIRCFNPIPGVLSDETSALTDSFQDGLLSGPIYTTTC